MAATTTDNVNLDLDKRVSELEQLVVTLAKLSNINKDLFGAIEHRCKIQQQRNQQTTSSQRPTTNITGDCHYVEQRDEDETEDVEGDAENELDLVIVKVEQGVGAGGYHYNNDNHYYEDGAFVHADGEISFEGDDGLQHQQMYWEDEDEDDFHVPMEDPLQDNDGTTASSSSVGNDNAFVEHSNAEDDDIELVDEDSEYVFPSEFLVQNFEEAGEDEVHYHENENTETEIVSEPDDNDLRVHKPGIAWKQKQTGPHLHNNKKHTAETASLEKPKRGRPSPFLQQQMANGTVDELQFVASKKDNTIQHQGFIYKREKSTPTTVYYCCSQSYYFKCRSRLKICVRDETFYITGTHSHPSHLPPIDPNTSTFRRKRRNGRIRSRRRRILPKPKEEPTIIDYSYDEDDFHCKSDANLANGALNFSSLSSSVDFTRNQRPRANKMKKEDTENSSSLRSQSKNINMKMEQEEIKPSTSEIKRTQEQFQSNRRTGKGSRGPYMKKHYSKITEGEISDLEYVESIKYKYSDNSRPLLLVSYAGEMFHRNSGNDSTQYYNCQQMKNGCKAKLIVYKSLGVFRVRGFHNNHKGDETTTNFPSKRRKGRRKRKRAIAAASKITDTSTIPNKESENIPPVKTDIVELAQGDELPLSNDDTPPPGLPITVDELSDLANQWISANNMEQKTHDENSRTSTITGEENFEKDHASPLHPPMIMETEF